ncbi:protein FAM32A [Tachypleus tridentatus]|uniref:protein FAM32A n=1 Tax=Tachypleus tridentatus TaxID=6853 RepID=UPI003FD0FF98
MSEYDFVSSSSLKLKRDDGCIKKKKKKKEKCDRKILEQVSKMNTNTEHEEKHTVKQVKLTKAEKAFRKMQEKPQMERILEKASKSHKQRVEEFNRHLDSLTEHYDIPKVSWTK